MFLPVTRQMRADNCVQTKTPHNNTSKNARIIHGLFARTGGGLEHKSSYR